MLEEFRAFWALFLLHSDKKFDIKKPQFTDPILGGGALLLRPPPPPWIRHCNLPIW